MRTLLLTLALLGCIAFASTAAVAADYLPGLAGHYYKDADNWNGLWPDDTDMPLADPSACTFSTFEYTRIEPIVNHLFIRSGWFSVRWVGYIDVPGTEANTFLFELWADDGCRMQIDDKVLVSSWYACPENIPQSHRTATATLTPGKHRIVIEYFQGQSLEEADSDPCKLYWSCPGLNLEKEIVPDTRLVHKLADEGTPDAWAIKPPPTVQELVSNLWDDAQRAEATGDYAHALRLYRYIIEIAPNVEQAQQAKDRVLQLEADPTVPK